jgi:hypothetical protein
MAPRRSAPTPPPPPRSPAERRNAIERLRRRIGELQALDPLSVQERRSPEIVRLEAAIDETLTAVFGRNTHRYRLYGSAADLEPPAVLSVTPSWIAARGGGGHNREDIHELQNQIGERKKRSIALLEQAIQGLEEEFVPESELVLLAQEHVADHRATSNSRSPTITEAQIRGRLLAIFHDRQHDAEGWVPTSDINMSPDPVSPQVIGGACRQLADIGLIQWRPLGAAEGFIVGMAKITGKGVAAVEAGWSADIDIRIPTSNGGAASSPPISGDAPMSDAALTEIREVVSTIKAELPALTLSNSTKADITADINQIEIEIERPTPRRRFMKMYLESLRDNLAKAAGAATAGGIIALVAGLIAKYFHVF